MSTGADCRLVEKEKGKWYYELQRWPYGEWPEYDTFGPFPTFRATMDHLNRNHANPGGFNVLALPGCPHDLLSERPHDKDYPEDCDRCGNHRSAKIGWLGEAK